MEPLAQATVGAVHSERKQSVALKGNSEPQLTRIGSPAWARRWSGPRISCGQATGVSWRNITTCCRLFTHAMIPTVQYGTLLSNSVSCQCSCSCHTFYEQHERRARWARCFFMQC